jgi:hypothetical protein
MTSLISSLILVSIVSPKSLNRRYTSHVVQFEEARVPFIYLSAGVSESVFRASLELAKEAHVPYSGVLCGRATWQGGLAAYIEGGKDALRTWLGKQGVQNIEALNEVLQHLGEVRLILLMGTRLGVKDQSLDPSTYTREQTVGQMICDHGYEGQVKIEVDGGIREQTVPLLRKAGADLVVPGSLVFKSDHLAQRFEWLHAFPAPTTGQEVRGDSSC